MSKIIYKIKEITIDEVLPFRQKVMWPDKPIDYVKLTDDHKAKHFGLVVNDQVITIISLFYNNDKVQFRKFATLIEFQGKGYGSILLKKILNMLKQENITKVWCNARKEKTSFYKRFNLDTTDQEFTKGNIDYIIMERSFNL